ncbi:MAG: porin [Bradyrhizobium sp.]|uniref:porin n=1 Tax=Bradyrhizobium sp. TaxID=376 RepID=UPI002730998D|nr:porin [Bradyrhizobium sp.]MDP1867186.1 porin [Bradyrhizobium sp.]
MRNVPLLIAITALWPASSAAAEQPRPQKSDKSGSTVQQLPLKRAGAERSCAAYGAGFVRVDGTPTCVKIGGAVSIGVGGSR